MEHNQTASEGCVVISRDVRIKLAESKDRYLSVTE